MGLISKLKKVFGVPTDAVTNTSLEVVRKEMRSHSRYPISFSGEATVILADGWVGTILDISYGGIAVSFESSKCDLSESVSVMSACSITILGKSHPFQLKTVRTIPSGKDTLYIGFCFEHTAPDTLIYLREIIEPIRSGRSLEELSSEFKSEQYKDKNWHCFRGDGPVDLVLLTDEGKTKVIESLLTIKLGNKYLEIGIRNEKLWTSKSTEGVTTQIMGGARMHPTSTPDLAILRNAFLILASVPVRSKDTVRPLLEAIIASIKRENRPAA